jgi:hypothetical protein
MSGPSANKIQIKRSTTNAVVTGLSNGELAFTQASNVLFIGLPDGSGVAPIGGVRYPGTLTANQALVANSSSAIDKVIVANAVITYLTANGALGVASQVLSTNSSGGIFWRDGGSLGTNVDAQYAWTNTQTFSNTITFSSTINGTANNALYLGGTIASSYALTSALSNYQTTAGLSANVATLTSNNSTYAFGKTEVNLNVNNALTSNNASYLGTFAAANYVQNTESRTLSGNLYLTGANTGFSIGYFVGGQPGAAANSVSANTIAILIGNSSVSSTVNSTSFSGTANNSSNLNGKSEGNLNVNSASSATNANNAAYLGGTAAADYQTTAGLSANVATLTSNNSTYAFGKTEVNLNVNNALTANSASYLGSSAAANFVQNTDSRTLSGNLYFTGANSGFSTSIFIGAQPGATGNSVSANTTALLVGNATVFSTINSTAFSGSAAFVGGNSAGDLRTYSETQAGNAYTWAMANTLSRNGSYTGNNSFGGTNTVISSNLTISGSILADIVPTGNGTINLGSATHRFGTIYLAGSTISLGNTSLSDEAVGGLTVPNMNVTSGFTSSGNTKLGDSTSDVVSFAARVNTSIVPSANITYNLGTIDLRYDKVFGSNVVSEYINVGKDLTVSGNLYVTGTVAYINTTSFSTTDTLLQFASNNTVTDILDIGFFGEYNESSTVKYTGLFRDASDGTYALFTGLTDAPVGTVNTGDASFGYASLKTYITSSALVANATQTNITANSSVSVSLTANTLNFDKIDAGTF